MVFNLIKRGVNFMFRLFNLQLSKLPIEPEAKVYHRTRGWDYGLKEQYWIGGRFKVSNFSNGYHGILQQWWEHYNTGHSCLLVSENNKVKHEFQLHYPDWKFATLDYYDNKGEPIDIEADLCSDFTANINVKYDLIICQATLEHLYNPFTAMQNMLKLLAKDGVVVLHTHLPSYYYHPYPRDYFRFHTDWFEDVTKFIPDCELLELYTVGGHVFAAYKQLC